MTKDNNTRKDIVKVKKGRPYYSPFLGCYVIDYSVNGEKSFKTFDTPKEGTEWLKATFPDWFRKHYTSPVNQTT